ncbi:MAG: FtsQ-type POTRA domain-containing protein, partial [Bacteroidales bacterium]|nr:FtsQ-type POTRA domain-containing protein [Bacteroidales bacterium]
MSSAASWRKERATPAAKPGRRAAVLLGRLLVAAMGIAVLAVGLWGLGYLYRTLDVPIALIGVDGEITHLSTREVEDIVAANLSGGFLSLDLKDISTALEKHPWVAAASARRQWPDRLVIVIHEEVPIARWGDSGVLNNRGRPLAVGDAEGLDEL